MQCTQGFVAMMKRNSIIRVRKVGGKKNLSLRNCCGLFQVKARFSRPKNMVASDPSDVTKDMPQDPIERKVSEDAPDKGYNYILPLIMFKSGVLINQSTQFSLMHSLGVPLVCMRSFRLIDFMVLELWRRHTHTPHTHTDLY